MSFRFGVASAIWAWVAFFPAIAALSPGFGVSFRVGLLLFVGVSVVAWTRLCVRVEPCCLEIKNLFSTTRFDLCDPSVVVSLRNKQLHARIGDAPAIRAWGVSGGTTGNLQDFWIPAKWAKLEAAIRAASGPGVMFETDPPKTPRRRRWNERSRDSS